MGKFGFRKEERLKKEKDIQELFNRGSSFYLFPFKILVMPHADEQWPSHQVLLSVSKRNFKRAVDRNKIKRRMREAYRLQKDILPSSPKLKLGIIYTHKEILLFDDIRKRMYQLFAKISKTPFEIPGAS